jgi:hypothetical protein
MNIDMLKRYNAWFIKNSIIFNEIIGGNKLWNI